MLGNFGIKVSAAPLLSERYIRRLFANQTTHWGELLSSYARRISHLLHAKDFDLVWIEKELFPNLPAWFERILAHLGIPYIVDYDDAIFDRYGFSRNPLKRLLGRKLAGVMPHASLVICGNDSLADRAKSAAARRVEIIPSVVGIERYSLGQRSGNGRVVVVWIGAPTTAKYLSIA